MCIWMVEMPCYARIVNLGSSIVSYLQRAKDRCRIHTCTFQTLMVVMNHSICSDKWRNAICISHMFNFTSKKM